MSLFNVLYMSASFSQQPSWDIFGRMTLAQLTIYLVKAIVVYYSIYSIIPRWVESQQYGLRSNHTGEFIRNRKTTFRYFLEFLGVVLIGTLMIRVLTHYVVWTYIFQEGPGSLNFNSLLARYIYSLFDLIPIALAAVAIKLVQLRITTLKQESKIVADKLKTELQFLKSQTNPHFLFNTLNGIYGLSRKQDSNAPKAILNLSKILRYMLYESSAHTNPIGDELQLIADYIALQKLRFQDHLDISFFQEIDDRNTGISPLLLLPLVENAFKHSHDLNTRIEIHVRLHKGKLFASITNNTDQENSTVHQEDGIGLANIRRQLAILYRDYQFDVIHKDSIFEVRLSIDLNASVYA